VAREVPEPDGGLRRAKCGAVSDQACLAQGLPVGSLRVRRPADQTLGSDA